MTRRVPVPLMRCAATAALVMSVTTISGCSPEEPDPPPLSSITTAPSTGPTITAATAEDLAFEDAEAALRRHVDLLNALGHHPTDQDLLRQLHDTSNGQEYNLQNTTYRYDWGPRGIHLKGDGNAVVRSVKRGTARLDRKRPTVTLRACIDGREAVAVTKTGKLLAQPGSPPMADLTFTVMLDPDHVWRVNASTGDGVFSC